MISQTDFYLCAQEATLLVCTWTARKVLSLFLTSCGIWESGIRLIFPGIWLESLLHLQVQDMPMQTNSWESGLLFDCIFSRYLRAHVPVGLLEVQYNVRHAKHCTKKRLINLEGFLSGTYKLALETQPFYEHTVAFKHIYKTLRHEVSICFALTRACKWTSCRKHTVMLYFPVHQDGKTPTPCHQPSAPNLWSLGLKHANGGTRLLPQKDSPAESCGSCCDTWVLSSPGCQTVFAIPDPRCTTAINIDIPGEVV